MPQKRFTFVHATPMDRGSHTRNLPEINSHVATHGHLTRYVQPPERKGPVADKNSRDLPEFSVVDKATNNDFPVRDPCPHLAVTLSTRPVSGLCKQISTTLDPFVRLPLNVSDREKILLHSYLTERRRLELGTSAYPAYCPALDVAHKLLQTCSVYVLTHIVISEAMHSVQRGGPATGLSHWRRAQAYKAMDELLQDHDVSLDRKLFGLIQLNKMEQFIGSPALETLHLQALHDYIESNGGLSSFLHKSPGDVVLDPIFYAGQFVHAKLPIRRLAMLEAIQIGFVKSLERIQLWTESLQLASSACSHTEKLDNRAPTENVRDVRKIIRYTNHIIMKWCDSDTESSFQASAVFFFCFVLCTIMVEANFDTTEAVEFLFRAQHCIESSALSNGGGSLGGVELKPEVATKILNHVRRESGNPGSRLANEEIRVCEAAIDAQRACSLLKGSTRLQLTRRLAKSAFVVTGTGGVHGGDDISLHQLRREMYESWTEE